MTTELDRLIGHVSALSAPTVLVVGDVMLDRYVWGEVDRISPEAPVPVLDVLREEERPGGAANVARNIAALGARAILVGLVGDDPAARRLRELCAQHGMDARMAADRRQTTTKIRYLALNQQLLRADREDRHPGHGSAADAMVSAVRDALGEADIVLVSDYAKGVVVPPVMDALRAADRPVVIDPKPIQHHLYKGFLLMTPNHREAAAIAGTDPADTPPREAADAIAAYTDHVLVTCGPRGMLLREADGRTTELPARARSVYDVSGAGDTVVAVAGLALGAGLSALEAAELANHAAGVVVGKVGKATVSADELRRAVREDLAAP